MKYTPLPSQERLQELFEYSVITGELYNRVTRHHSAPAGTNAGSLNCRGYLCIQLDRTKYLVHRLVWRLVTGEDPGSLQIDHIDGDKTNNAWHNLRLATYNQNNQNAKRRSDSTTGYKGVRRDRSSFASNIQVQGRRHYLGNFHTPEEAHAAYCAAAEQLHGEYARTQ